MNICSSCGKTEGKIIDHHQSYNPEIIVKLCISCHTKAHNNRGKISARDHKISVYSAVGRYKARDKIKQHEPLTIDDELRIQINSLLV